MRENRFKPGYKTGVLKIICESGKDEHYHRIWLCQCECKRFCRRTETSLRKAEDKGAIARCPTCRHERTAELLRENRRRQTGEKAPNYRHGLFGASNGVPKHLCGIFYGMCSRCNNPNDSFYHRYGGRGISVWEGWPKTTEGLRAFVEYIEENLGPRPEGQSLDRRNNDLGYQPGNLRWATPKQQSNNMRRSLPAHKKRRTRMLYQEGHGCKSIAKRLGFNEWSVRYIVRDTKVARKIKA
jgi:hypothetical protein